MTALNGETVAHPAVIATRPAIAPLSENVALGLPVANQEKNNAPIAPAAAARLVVTIIRAIDRSIPDVVLPALKPNQPNHNRNTPSAANGILWPGMFFTSFLYATRDPVPEFLIFVLTYLPIRGPRTNAPASPAHPPTECTTVDPAKSIKPRSLSQPPPQIHRPTMG